MNPNILIHDNVNLLERSQTIVYNGGLAILELKYNRRTPLEARISRLLVHETVRGKGMGNELLKIAEDIARKDGKEIIVIYADKTKPELTMWYSDMGYTIIEDTEDLYKMQKNIKQLTDYEIKQCEKTGTGHQI